MALQSHLTALESAGLVRLVATQPELEYLFRHALVQEAAYDSLIKTSRRHLHRAVGEVMERTYADRLDEMAGVLAHHFGEAGDREKAVDYARRAARRARAAYAYEEAAAQLQSALDRLGDGGPPALRLTVLEELADTLVRMGGGARAIRLYQEALDVGSGLKEADPTLPARLHRKILQTVADIKWTVGSEAYESAQRAAEASRAALRRGVQQAGRLAPDPEAVRARVTLSTDAWRNRVPPDWEAAHRHASAAVELAERLGDPVELSAALAALGNVLFGRGELRQSLDAARRRLRLVSDDSFGDRLEQTDATREAGSAWMYVGEYAQAIALLEQAEAMSQRIQAIDQQFGALALQAQCWFGLDGFDKVLEVEARWRALEERYPRERLGPICFAAALTGSVYAQRGDSRRAKALRREAYNIMAAVSGPVENWVRNQFY